MIWRIAMFTLELLKLVPAGLLVRQVHPPLNIDERARVTAAFNLITELEWTTMWMFVVVSPNLESRGLPLHPAFLILECCDWQFDTFGSRKRIATFVTVDRQHRRLFRRNTKVTWTVAK